MARILNKVYIYYAGVFPNKFAGVVGLPDYLSGH